MLESLQRSMIGKTVGRYRLEEAFSPGKTGQTYRAVKLDGGQIVALKLLKPMRFDTALQAVFFSELESINALEHANIVRVLDFGEDHPNYFVASELVADGSLNTWIQQETRDGQRPSLEIGLDLMRQAAEGLAFAHRKNVVHGEVQPGNMLLARTGSRYNLKLSDFRLAQIVMRGSGNSDDDAGLINEPKYISPDHVMPGGIQTPSDVYSLGIVMYHVFTGLVPFEVRDHGDAMVKHVYEQPRPLREARPDVYPELEQLVLKCLLKRPTERPSADEVRDTLQAILEMYHKNVRSTRMLAPIERLQSTPNIPTPELKSDWPRISVVDPSGQVISVRELTPSGLSVGREQDNSIVLEADTVSRHHMRLDYDGKEVKLLDMSTNGSFLIGGGTENTRLPSQKATIWPWRSIVQVAPYWLRLEQPSSMSTPSRLVVSLEKERVELVPGQPTTVRVTVANLGRLVDHLYFEVEGVPDEWVRVPEDRWQLNPNDQGSVMLTITAPRNFDARAGDYRVKIRAKSYELKGDDGELEYGEALALWVVLPFTQSKLGLRPSSRSTRRHTKFTAYLENESNTPVKFQLKAQDTDRRLFCGFEDQRPPLRFPPTWKGVIQRWIYFLTRPFIAIYQRFVMTFLGPYMQRLMRARQDMADLIGHEDTPRQAPRVERPPDPDFALSPGLLVQPGEKVPVDINVWTNNFRLMGRPLHRPFNLSADALEVLAPGQPKDMSALVRGAKPPSMVGQLTHLGWIPIWLPFLIALGLIALAILLSWTPTIRNFLITPLEGTLIRENLRPAQPFTLSWKISQASTTEIYIGGASKPVQPKPSDCRVSPLPFGEATCKYQFPNGLPETTNVTIVARNVLPILGRGQARDPQKAGVLEIIKVPEIACKRLGGNTPMQLIEGQAKRVSFDCKTKNALEIGVRSSAGEEKFPDGKALKTKVFTIDAPDNHQFEFIALGEKNSQASDKITVIARAVKPRVQFSASPSTVTQGQGQEVVLSWNVVGAPPDSVDIDNDGGSGLPLSDQIPLSAPDQTTTYKLTAKNFSEVGTASARVNVRPPVDIAACKANDTRLECRVPCKENDPRPQCFTPPERLINSFSSSQTLTLPYGGSVSARPLRCNVSASVKSIQLRTPQGVKTLKNCGDLAKFPLVYSAKGFYAYTLIVVGSDNRKEEEGPVNIQVSPDRGWIPYTYVTNFGALTIEILGDKVRGASFKDELKGDSGAFSETRLERDGNDEQIVTQLSNGDEITLYLLDNRKRVSGNRSGVKWCGSARGVAFATDCSFAGTWQIKIPQLNKVCTLEAAQVGLGASGKFECTDKSKFEFSRSRFSRDLRTQFLDTNFIVGDALKDYNTFTVSIQSREANSFSGQLSNFNDKSIPSIWICGRRSEQTDWPADCK